jgi:hypothetical protein
MLGSKHGKVYTKDSLLRYPIKKWFNFHIIKWNQEF